MKQFLAPSTLLLVVLLFPGLSRVIRAKHQDPEGPRKQEESPGRGRNMSHPLHHQVKRYLVPRTPPFPDTEPGFKVVRCMKEGGKCQTFCNYMEFQLGYCSKKKEACCLPLN
ncbi:sperm-associated antigen 11B-like [Moschus berezovskii]|uniref:sperm-associated antigen 11B-like n=1 Tax=Moschus berezovskii TaxID=68408 RepID=UPI00244473A8|nr:sperm-associated antigen 11B-like [Moschus berezovskii]